MKRYNLEIKELIIEDFQKVLHVICGEVRLEAIIAIHQTKSGPAVGGIRALHYDSFDDALNEALRLARGMTYKAVLSNTGTGGGKSVIKLPNDINKITPDMLKAFGQAVDLLQGEYICAEDMGVSVQDMNIIAEETSHLTGLDTVGGDPSWFTAYGVYLSIKETAKYLWGTDSLESKKVLIQGVGAVGSKLAGFLFWDGAELLLSDLQPEKLDGIAKQYSANIVSEIPFGIDCDIFAPCARGAIINHDTCKIFKCKAIIGAANNQLLDMESAKLLADKDILYGPDYLVNAGGLMNVISKPYNAKKTLAYVKSIPGILGRVYTLAEQTGKDTASVADALVEEQLAAMA